MPAGSAAVTPKDTRLETLDAAFKALSDPTRLRILGLLAQGEICVCHIHECLGIPQPTASRHLAYLRKKGLVSTRKEGLWVHYSLAPLDDAAMRVLMGAITHCLRHCDAIDRDRQRLETQTGCCSPSTPHATFECCLPKKLERVPLRKRARRSE
jgi:ArsR family transcriptional regulator